MTDTRNEPTHANRETVRRAFEAWRDGAGTITDLFATDMVWRTAGRPVVSREYGSRQEFVDEVLASFGARFSSSSDPFRPVTIRSLHADGDTVIVRWDGRGGRERRRAVREQLRVVHGDARRQGRRRHGVLRQHRVQRPLEPRPARPVTGRGSVPVS